MEYPPAPPPPEGVPPGPTGPLGGYGLELPTGVGVEAYPGVIPGPGDNLPAISLSLGVLGLVGGLCCFGQVASIAAIAVGLTAISKRPRPGTPGRTMAGFGIALGVIELLGTVAFIAAAFVNSATR